MSVEVLQSFASEAGRLMAERDAAAGTNYARIKIRPVVGRIDSRGSEGIGVYVDDLETEADFGGGGATNAMLHFVLSSPQHSRLAEMQGVIAGLDRFAGHLPIWDVVGGRLSERAGARLSVFSCSLAGSSPSVGMDDIFSVDVSFRVMYDLEISNG